MTLFFFFSFGIFLQLPGNQLNNVWKHTHTKKYENNALHVQHVDSYQKQASIQASLVISK